MLMHIKQLRDKSFPFSLSPILPRPKQELDSYACAARARGQIVHGTEQTVQERVRQGTAHIEATVRVHAKRLPCGTPTCDQQLKEAMYAYVVHRSQFM